jgi:ATP phosphoribosyltransferase
MNPDSSLVPLMASVRTRQHLHELRPTWTGAATRSGQMRLGIPNTGKLRDLAGRLVARAFSFDFASKQLLFDVSDELQILRARSTDLPHLLANGIVDVAITGDDYCFESGEDLLLLGDLHMIHGRVCLLTRSGEVPPRDSTLRISTQYPRHAMAFKERAGLAAQIMLVSGAGELYPRLGLADASVDCVVTGRTCRENGLRIAAVIRPVMTGIYVRTADAASPAMDRYWTLASTLLACSGPE